MARAWLAGDRTVLVTTQDARPAESRIELRIDRERALTTDASALGMNLMLPMSQPPIFEVKERRCVSSDLRHHRREIMEGLVFFGHT